MDKKMFKITFTWAFLVISTILATVIGGIVPILGSAVIAILIGFVVRHTLLYDKLDFGTTKFVEKYMLKAGIVLLGFKLSLNIVGEVGINVLIVLFVEVLASIIIAILLKKALNIGDNLATLLGIGTSICGGAAIVATSPILEANEDDVAVSITTMFIYSVVSLLVLPFIGKFLGYNDQLYGILAGAAVNDTASVVATAKSWSDDALSIATIVKLVRTLYIVPVTLAVIGYKINKSSKKQGQLSFKTITKIVPKFVILFILAVLFATVVNIPKEINNTIKEVSGYLMTIALVTIGLAVHSRDIKKAGIRPVVLGGICWLAVLITTIITINLLY